MLSEAQLKEIEARLAKAGDLSLPLITTGEAGYESEAEARLNALPNALLPDTVAFVRASKADVATLVQTVRGLRRCATIEWRPIETAPRDGQTILAFNDGHVVTVKWRYDDRWGGVWGAEDYIQDGSIYDDALIAHNPTHWMPLPEPPLLKPQS